MNQVSPEYLIVTNKRDITSDYIVREFQKRSLPFYRLNTEDIHACTIMQSDVQSTLQGNISIQLNGIKSAYFRRPGALDLTHSDLNHNAKSYCVDEWEYTLRSLYLELGHRWFCHPNNIILAEDKIRQLRIAKEVGFTVPETIITNDKEQTRKLFCGGAVVAKPMRHALIDEGETGEVIFTSDIQNFDAIDPLELKLAPVIFQRKILKDCDLRVTVVGSNIFPVKIASQVTTDSQTDWRKGASEKLDHVVVELPIKVSEACLKIVSALNLRFGAIDLVRDSDGQYWFLECNPNGQWAWIENRTGLGISAAIVDEMVSIGNA